uniref:PDZ domain-containing protein n=1 Tax=Cyprinodon variegatus TaxID=28743 RepID=A0A3Q2DF82_CYPVA
KPQGSFKKMLQRYGSLSGKLHLIELEKDPAAHGLGIRLAGNDEGSRARMSVCVEAIDPRGPAGLDGRIQVGDELLEINGKILYGRSHQNASTIINNAPSKVKIILIRINLMCFNPFLFLKKCVSSLILKHQVTVKLSISRSKAPFSSPPPLLSSLPQPPHHPAPSSEPLQVSACSSTPLVRTQTSPAEGSYWSGSTPSTSDPQSCPVVAGRLTTIEICKGNLGLGLSIVGGCDTLLGAVIIHEVNDGGAAQRDGRLQAGDQILEVNDIDLRQATHDEAIAVLRLTTQRVRLSVFRHQEAYREEDLWDVFNLVLTPCPGEGLGFTTVGKSDDTGIFVSEIIRGGVAESDGSLLLGDQILSIDGEDVRAASQEHAQKLLQCNEEVHLEVARFKAGLQYSQRTPTLNDLLISLDCEFTHTLNNKVLPVCLISPQGPCDTLGISLAGGVGSLHGNTPLFIASMDTNGLAAKTEKLEDGRLKRGDQIIAVNGHCLEANCHSSSFRIYSPSAAWHPPD